MKKELLIFTLLGLIVFPALGFAACDPAIPASCVAPSPNFAESVQKVLNLFFWAILLIAVIYIMIAAYSFITGGGDPAAVAKGMTAVRNAVIGLIVAVLARGLAIFATTVLGGVD